MKTYPSVHPAVGSRIPRLSWLFLAGLMMMVMPLQVRAQNDLAVQKLFGHWQKSPTGYIMGYGMGIFTPGPKIVTASEAWIAAGTPVASERTGFASEGAVQIFNGATGAWVRELLPPLPGVTGRQFGSACAISGNLIAVGAIEPGIGAGKVYVYSLPGGALVKTLVPAGVGDGGSTGDIFGAVLAFSGDWVVVGAPADDANRGSVYFFNLKTAAAFKRLGGSANDLFGASLAVEGRTLLIGAPGKDSSRGMAYVYDIETHTSLKTIQPGTTAAGDRFGLNLAIQQGRAAIAALGWNSAQGRIYIEDLYTSNGERILTASDGAVGSGLGFVLAINNGMLLVGAPFHNGSHGASYVFDLNSNSTTEMRKLVQPEAGLSYYGFGVGMAGNNAVVAFPFDNSQAAAAGSLYLFRPVVAPSPLTKVAAKGDFAPGAAEVTFNALGDAFINRDGEAAFISTLAGPGSGGGKDTGMWDTLAPGKPLDLVIKSRLPDPTPPGPLVGVVSGAMPNCVTLALVRSTLTGTGVTGLNNQAVYKDDGAIATRIMRTGDGPLPIYGGGVPINFMEVRAARGNADAFVATTFALRNGVVSTDATNDSGVVLLNATTGTVDSSVPREKNNAGATGKTYGQFVGRLAYYNTIAVYPTAITGVATAFNQGLFRKSFNSAEILVTQKGEIPAAPGGAPYTAFLGESTDDQGHVLYRATLGAPATSANNEGLWDDNNGTKKLVLRKGVDLAPSLPGLKVAKILSFRATYNQSLILVQLAGPGVSAANDQALLLYQTYGTFNNQLLTLVREGEPAPGCNGALIGTISRFEVEPYYGEYVVLATLTGAAPGTELALFRGLVRHTSTTGPEEILRRPVLALRKGWQFANQPSRIKSISIPTGQTASGAGTVGLGRCIQESFAGETNYPVAVTVEFDNGVRQIMTGTL